MKCKNCQEKEAVKYSQYSSGEFCSVACARSYSTMLKRVEINKKVSDKLKGRKISEYGFKKGFDCNRHKITKEEAQDRILKRILNTSFEKLGFKLKKKKILLEQNYKCAICGCDPIHNGKDLNFQRDHINGNHKDDRRENLRMICPNCHSQTETFTSRNASVDGRVAMSKYFKKCALVAK